MNILYAARALGGNLSGGQIVAPGPGHSPRDRSLSVRFDCNAPDGFVVVSFANDDWRICRDHVRARLGLAAAPTRRPRPTTRSTTRPADEAARKRAALRIWAEGGPLRRSPGEQYLVEHRRLDVRRLDLDHVLRWHAGIGAIVAVMTDATTNEPCGVHRTFLDRDGRKLGRKMLGRKGVIRLSPDDAVTLGLGIVEGVEDGLAVLSSGWCPIWSTADAGAMAKFPVLRGIEELTIFADADAAGIKAALECAQRWLAHGRETCISPPPARAEQ